MADLAKFIEQYLKNKKISDYEGWLALYGRDSEKEYREARAEADTTYAQARAEHGRTAAALYERGLSGSGYSDYLSSNAFAERVGLYDKARERKAATDAENRRGYLSYLEQNARAEADVQAKKESEQGKIFKDLLAKNILDRGAAVTYLIGRGIDEETAVKLANKSIEVAHNTKSYIATISQEARAMYMDYHAAYQYALTKGVSEEMARSVAQIAQAALELRGANYSYYD